MSSNKIELRAVNEIESFLDTPRLDPVVNKRDKELCWDGYISIYKDSSNIKKSFIGRVPVQIKGKTLKENDFKNKISYPVSVIDLQNYLKDIGAIFLVVGESKTSKKRKVYYAELSPIKLKILLNKCTNTKTLNIPMKAMPLGDKYKEDIFLNFYKNSYEQVTYIHKNNNVMTLNELMQKGISKKIHLTQYSFSRNSISEYIQDGTFYAYASCEVNGIKVDIPIDIENATINSVETVDTNININGKTYYDYFIRKIYQDKIEISLGSGFIFSMPRSKEYINFNFTDPKNVRDIARDYQFLIEMIDNNGFSIDNHKIKFNSSEIKSAFNLGKINFVFNEARKYVEILDFLHCKKDLDYFNLTETEHETLQALYVSLIEKKSVYLTSTDECIYSRLKVSNLIFLLLARKDKNSDGKYFIRDIFDKSVQISFEVEKGKLVTLPNYAFLSEDDILNLDNICFEKIIPSIKNFKKSEYLFYYSLDLFDFFCKAFSTSKDGLYFSVAKDLYFWLEENKKQYDFITNRLDDIVSKNKKLSFR